MVVADRPPALKLPDEIMQHPVTQYALDVIDGKIVAGRLVKLACERHLRDLQHGHERGLQFLPAEANHAYEFYGYVKHTKGEWAGRVVELQPWQQFIIGSIFGWWRTDGTRRFHYAYCEVARKNGKSTLAAPVGLYTTFFDDEPGADVFAVATKKDQAKIVWDEAAKMVKASPFLRSRIKTLRANMHSEASNSKFEPLGADSKTQDGLNVHCAVIDELHAHKTRQMWDVIETATGARRNWLVFTITTAGYDQTSVCWEQHDYVDRVLRGVFDDDSYFGYIAALDDGDDWRDEAVWIKANPSLGVTIPYSYIRDKIEKAMASPQSQQATQRLHLNIWTGAEKRWLNMDHYDRAVTQSDPAELDGRMCYAGLDLARVHDISAFVLVFPPAYDGEKWKVIPRFWVPEDDIVRRSETGRVPYYTWHQQGFMETTPGNTTDFDFILAAMLEEHAKYDIREVAYDRLFAGELVNNATNEGIVMVPFGQGWVSMDPPMKEFERLLLASEIEFPENPVLRWMADNAVARADPSGNTRPDKERSADKIDGVVAILEGLGRAMVRESEPPSVYESRGIRTI